MYHYRRLTRRSGRSGSRVGRRDYDYQPGRSGQVFGVKLVRGLPRSWTGAAGPVEGKWQRRQNQQRMERRRKDEGREMEGAGAVAHERGIPLRNASVSDRDETEDMTAATCSKPSPNPAEGRGCIDSSATIDTNDQPYRRRQYLYPSSGSRIRAVGDR